MAHRAEWADVAKFTSCWPDHPGRGLAGRGSVDQASLGAEARVAGHSGCSAGKTGASDAAAEPLPGGARLAERKRPPAATRSMQYQVAFGAQRSAPPARAASPGFSGTRSSRLTTQALRLPRSGSFRWGGGGGETSRRARRPGSPLGWPKRRRIEQLAANEQFGKNGKKSLDLTLLRTSHTSKRGLVGSGLSGSRAWKGKMRYE